MGVLDALLQGIIQGITEFLPISSSGHLSLYQYFFGAEGEASLFFSLMLHLGTLAAVIAAFYEDLWRMILELGRMVQDIFRGQFSFKTENPDRKMIFMLILATIPMVLIVPIRGFVGGIAEDRDIIVEGVFFLLTSLLLFAGCKMRPGRAGIRRMKPKHALIIGVVQDFAVFPGLSRSGSTISAGMILGFDRSFMFKFSFLMGIPTILGGAVFEIGDAVKEGVKVEFLPLFLGMLSAAVFGYLSIILVRKLLLSDKFIIFAWYTLVLGILVIIVGIVCHIIGFEGFGAVGAASKTISTSVGSSSSSLLEALSQISSSLSAA